MAVKTKEELQEYLKNEHVQWIVYNIYKYESDKTESGGVNLGGFNQNAGDSSAFGAGQFIGKTRNTILKQYGVDAWSDNIEEQELAILALIDSEKDRHGGLETISTGDVKTFADKSNQWQAFYPSSHKDAISNTKHDILVGERPTDWQNKFVSMRDTAVYEPQYSWNKINPKVQNKKIELYNRSYSDSIPDSLNVAVPQILGNTKPTVTQPSTSITEGFDMEPITAVGDQTQAQDPAVTTSTITPPTIENIPSKEEWMKEKEKEVKKKEIEKVEEKEEIYNDGLSTPTFEEIQDSIAKGEQSMWNRGPDGEILAEGFTMDSTGTVVWVGEGPEPDDKTAKIEEEVTEEQEELQKEKEKQENIDSIKIEKTQEIEVMDVNGNISTITTPVISEPDDATEEMIKSIDEKAVDKIPVKVEEPEVEEVAKPVKPQMKDFKTSSDYMKARKEYYKSIEGDLEDGIIEDEFTDEEIAENVDRERNRNSIDSNSRNIFNTSSGNNIFQTIIGDVDNLLQGISAATQVDGSLNSLESFVDLTGQEAITQTTTASTQTTTASTQSTDDGEEITIVEGGIGPGGTYRTETTTTQEALDAKEKYEKENPDLGELVITGIGETPPPISESKQKASAEEQEALDLVFEFEKDKKEQAIKDAKLTGNMYNERQSLLKHMDISINKSTIETLALRNPDVLNIEDGIVTDNSGNIIETEDQWLNFASKPKNKGGLGFQNADVIYNNTSNQFKSDEYKDFQTTQKAIDGAWNYFKTSVATETGNQLIDIGNLIGNIDDETINLGKYENEIKREFLNEIPLKEIQQHYDQSIGKYGYEKIPFIESMSLPEKESRLQAAKTKVLETQNKILEKAYGDLVLQGDDVEIQGKKLQDGYNDWISLQEKTQEDLNILREKHGSWSYDQTGNRVYIPRLDKSRWPKGDQLSLNAINESLSQLETNRVGLNSDRGAYMKAKNSYNTNGKDLYAQSEQLLFDLKWNEITNAFDPEFQMTKDLKRYDNFYTDHLPGFVGKTLDVATVGVEGYLKLATMGMVAVPAAITAGSVYSLEKFGLSEYFSEHGPYKKSEINEGYTHSGQIIDGLLGIWGKNWGPDSDTAEGEWMVKGYESKKNTVVGRWIDNVAGGGSNLNVYSGAKGLARLIPYVALISGARNITVGAQKEAVKKFGSRAQKSLTAIGQAKLGKSIVTSLDKSRIATDRFAKVLNMNKINWRITVLDNVADGRARGLDHASAFTYGNALSFITGLTQSIMPDYLYLDALKKGAFKKFAMDFVQSVKNKTLTKLAREEALKKSLPQFFSMFGKEQLEEYLDVAGHDFVKSMYIAGHSPDILKSEVNAEIFRATSMLTIPLAGLGAVGTHRNTKATIYNHFHDNAVGVINYGNQNIKALNHRLKNLTNSKKDQALKKILEAEIMVVESQVNEAENLRRAINVAPDMVTDTQLDLLIQKHKLIDERTKLKNKDKVANKGKFQELTDEITKIDEQIEEHTIENYQETLYDRLLVNAKKLAEKMDVTIEHVDIDTSTKEGKEEFFKYVELAQKQRRKHNSDIDKEINDIKKKAKNNILSEEQQQKIEQLQSRKQVIPDYDGPGVILYNDVTGKHEIIIDKNAAAVTGNSAVVLHELLHAVLRKTVLNNPDAVRGMSYMLREELLKKDSEGNYIYNNAAGQVVGKFDAYKKELGNMSFDEMFTIFTEAVAQGNIKIETGILSKISDFIRRMFREIGVNFQITDPDEMMNFLRDFNHEVLSGRKNWSRGMRKIIADGRKSTITGKPLIKVSADAIAKAKEAEQIALKNEEIQEIWQPQFTGMSLSLGGKVTRKNIYSQDKIKEDLNLSENTKQIVEENERLRKLILEEGKRSGNKIVASEDLQTKLVENNLPAAIGLAKFAARNPKIMGLEVGKRVSYEQFVSGYYLQLSNLARTYDASVNEFGQYMNTILPVRYGAILEAEKKGAVEGSVGLDFVPDIPVDPDDDINLTPDDVTTGPKVNTAERLQIKDKTKPFIDKGLKQVKKLQDLRGKISEKYDDKTAEEIAELTAKLKSKGMTDLDLDAITVKQAPNLLYKFTSELFGIDEDKLNPNSKKWLANLRKDDKRGSNEVRAAQRAVAKHGQLILSTIFNEGHTAAFKSAGMPNSLLKFGYNKSSKRIGNSFPQYKKPNLSETDLLKFVGIEKVTKKGVTGYKFTVDRNTGTKLIAIASMVDRNMSLQGINEYLEESGDMTAKIKNSIEDGLANASRSIYYIKNVELQPVIKERLPLLGYKLQNVDDNWTTKQIKDIIIEVYKDTDLGVKGARAFANDLLKKTAVINKYKLLKRSSIARKEKPISLAEFLEQEFATIDIFEGVMAMLGISVDKKEDLYTKDNIKSVRKQVGDLALMIDKLEEENQKKIKEIDGSTKEGKKEIARLKREAMEFLFLLEQQHITAAKMGNGLYQAVAGTNDLELKGKIGKQRDQVFGSVKGAGTDFRLFVNKRMNNLQIPLKIKEANDLKKALGISTLSAQKSKAVIESIMNGKFDFDGRTAEAILARKLVKMQMKFYAELYKKGEITNEHYTMHMLAFGSSMSTVSRRAASFYGIQEGILSNDVDGKYIYGKIENAGKELEFEHGKPHGQLMLELNQIVLNEKESNWDKMMDEVFVDYKVNIITKAFDKVLTLSGVKDRMVPTGEVYEKGKEHGWEQRLYSKLTLGDSNIGVIISVDGKKTRHGQSFSKSINILPKSVAEINIDKKVSKGIEMAKSINYTDKAKGITVLDFDDTLATTKSLVKYTKPDGTTGTLNAEEYASTYENLLDKGYVFDFSEFNKVVKGKIAPLFQKALKLQKKFGPKNMFILTARPMEAQKAIFDFLRANGLNIPMENITGLGNSTSEAKALWMAEKVADGYNDFYFADDALQNVQAVDNMLNQFDVKRKVQQAKASYSIEYDKEFNKILEESTGTEAEKRFSRAKAKVRGEDKGKWNIFIPPSADDFVGLFYYFLGKGKKGEKHFKFFKEVLIDPLNKAYNALNDARQAIANDYKKLQKEFPDIKKNLYKKLPGTEFTYGDAIRVYLWDKAGFTIPGLSPTDQSKLVDIVQNDSNMKAYADTLGVISRAEAGYIEPTDSWLVEDIRVDLMNGMSKIHRKKFFAEFLENVKIIFSEVNLNKIEAIYGTNFREALEDILYRIENGTNRSFGSNRLVNRFMNWINGSIATTMFFNARSAVLQTLSTVNFINWSDNNVLAAAKAFGNQKQFWADFSMIFNSTFLKQRRAGINIDVNANEIANYVANSKNPVNSALNWLLQKGFLPTQIMDSFAIAAGGATFYRNRVKKYLVEGMIQKEAENQAFLDMQGIAEETQQSARPDKISQQQASVLGRLILAFQNTPMQYARLMKKAMLDLKDGRGDPKTHVSRIIYYGAIQNMIFYGMQTALFAMMFGDDDDEEFFDKKKERMLNGSLDSLLRGMGVGGAVVSTVKNMALKLIKEQDKPRYKRDENALLMELLNLSPPIGIKARQIQMGTRTLNWNEDTIKETPLYNLDNPIWEAGFNYTQALTNVPLARMHTKVTNLREAASKEHEAWQRIAMLMGWSKWNIGIKSKSKFKKKKKRKRLILR